MTPTKPSTRVEAKLWTQLHGIDAQETLRMGNISQSGVYLGYESAVGSPGDLLILSLASLDRAAKLTLAVRLVRCVTSHDLWRGELFLGAAFEFLPSTQQEKADLLEFVLMMFQSHVAAQRNSAPKALKSLNASTLTVETATAPAQGVAVALSLSSASHPPMVAHGTLGSFAQSDPQSRLRLEIDLNLTTTQAQAGSSIAQALQQLISNTLDEVDIRQGNPKEQLSGSLSRVRLATLLTIIEMEKLTGAIRLVGPKGAQATLYAQDGRVIDAHSVAMACHGAELVMRVMDWEEGLFDFVSKPVHRPDTVQMSTTHLVMEYAHRRDKRSASSADNRQDDCA